ncbi:MAG TPA: hypothetical protein VL752_20070 [Acidisoma sp.]|uniref:hypothetical protein n=1 Tax=Acidisoma sp. TaxID=1872115 RepID=UPI002C1FA6B0|nr:hypothetical protein [Acidisoma sp.]HTI03247.1 hypothetical protein [Acidisoma sp.]
MASLAQSQNRSLGRILAERVQALRTRFEVQMTALRERRRIARELETYSDEELAELGFSRLDIPAIAAGTYRR